MNPKNTITLIGAVKGESTYTEQQIFELLQAPQTDLGYGETFTGRPGTRLHLNDKDIIKVKPKIRLAHKDSIRWATQALQQEQRLQIHHPAKVWFVADEPETALIGNICPQLIQLHVKLAELEKSQLEDCLGYLKALFQHYFRVGQAFKVRLDEGLSNFGLSEDGILYYLDDDTYKWDRFISCSQMLGVYIRSQACLTPALGQGLGQIIRELILQYFNDPQYLTVLAEQLRDVFLSDQQRPIAISLINGLNEQKTVSTFVDDFKDSRYLALLADIHANLPALEAVLEFLETKGIHEGIILGDIVGYGPHPAACIERIQAMEKNFLILKGNHDHGLATGQFRKGFSKTARWALDWQNQWVSSEQKKWLLELAPVFRHENWLALHGAPVDPTFFNAYVYETTYENNLDALQKKAIPLCFHGHTHLPGVYGRIGSGFDKHEIAENIALDKFSHALVCPGSVGQPRNRQIGAQFAIYDRVQKNVQFYALDYDRQKTVEDMQAAQFPAFLIDFLL